MFYLGIAVLIGLILMIVADLIERHNGGPDV